jgi:TolA-binding protein
MPDSAPPTTPPASTGFSLLKTLLFCLGGGALLWWAGSSCSRAALVLTTDPPGATVVLNGRVAGAAPVRLTGLRSGSYCLRLEKEGYTPVARPVALPAEGLSLHEKLQPLGSGGLLVALKPRGAEVLLDGELLGHTPLTLAGVPVGIHEMVVRKTNFKPYSHRIDVQPGQTLEFKDFALEDIVLAMLRANVENEKQSVSHYMDLGHYLFVNDELDEAAEVYCRAQRVAAAPLEFPPNTPAQERVIEEQRRAEDRNRLYEEIKRKSHWPNKDVTKFRTLLAQQQDLLIGKNVKDWVAVRQSVQNLLQEKKHERAQALLLEHIAAVPNTPLLPQAYIELLQVRLQMHKLDGVRETYGKFFDLYGGQPVLLRQAANAVYTAAEMYQGGERTEVLTMAERMLRTAAKGSDPGKGRTDELHALCQFELANVLYRQKRFDQAAPLYRDSVAGTKDLSTKALRNRNLVECFKNMNSLAEARAVLEEIIKSNDANVGPWAKDELAKLGPSPEHRQ